MKNKDIKNTKINLNKIIYYNQLKKLKKTRLNPK